MTLEKLRLKLCRELAQTEHDVCVQALRTERLLGDTPPARALRDIAIHADTMRPRLLALANRGARPAVELGHAMGFALSAVRHALFDRLAADEEVFRDTLHVLRRGLDTARLLRAVAVRESDIYLMRYCDEMLVERASLIERAEQQLAWFAERLELELAAPVPAPAPVPASEPVAGPGPARLAVQDR